MKIEMDNNSTCVTLAIVAALLLIGGCYQCEETKREHLRQGYIEKMEQGTISHYRVWTKPE